jgi:glycosyltransferase involved in cell wall biosynthesis
MAHLLGSAALGGAEAFFERLVPALAAEDEVLPVIRSDDGRRGRLLGAGCPPVELPFGNYFDFATRRRLAATLSAFAPEVVVAWQNRASHYAGKLRQAGAPWPLVGRLGGYYDLKYYRHADHLVGNTRGLRAWFIAEGWPPERAHYVPNFAFDLAGAAPAPLAGAVKLLALGRLHRNKAFDVLLRALPALPGCTLSIAGQGPEQAALERLARELGVAERVHFLGWRTDTAALLAGCDIFVCPSRHEPLGNVVLEAWSAGRPVVAAASQGPTELIEDGVSGVLVPLESPERLAQAIGGLSADPERAAMLAAAGRQAWEREFSQPVVVAAWRGFLRGVVRQAGGAACAA